MDIKYTLTLPIEKSKSTIICFDAKVANMLLGTSAASGSFHLYGVVKKTSPQRWLIPISSIKARIKALEFRMEKDARYLDIMREVIK